MNDDIVFRALADVSRRHLLGRLHAKNGQDTRLALSRIDRCLVTACRVMASPRQSSPSVWPFFACSRSSKCRRFTSAKARKTMSSFISDDMQPSGYLSRYYGTERLRVKQRVAFGMMTFSCC